MDISITIDAKHSLSPREAQMLGAVLHTYKMVALQSATIEHLVRTISGKKDKAADGDAHARMMNGVADEVRAFVAAYFPDLEFKISVK